jgi:hypothetical protein
LPQLVIILWFESDVKSLSGLFGGGSEHSGLFSGVLGYVIIKAGVDHYNMLTGGRI